MRVLLDVMPHMLSLVYTAIVKSVVDSVGMKTNWLTEVSLVVSFSGLIICLRLDRMIHLIEIRDEVIKIEVINVG